MVAGMRVLARCNGAPNISSMRSTTERGRAAVELAKTRNADQLAEHAYALLVDETHRAVWEHGSAFDTQS
jgi:hypothetical protein